MRVLVFGGSFDPPHRGHAALLAAAARRIRPDRVLIVPAYQAPLKASPRAPARDRAAMARLALLPALPPGLRRRTSLDRGELRKGRRVYTVETLRRLKTRMPRAELHVALGSDAAAAFGRWRAPASLRRLARWWTAGRPGAPEGIPSFFGRLPGRMPDASSTALRGALARGEDVSGAIAGPVLRYIRRRRLYGTGLLRRLESSLSAERFAHTASVAKLAEALALRWGLDAEAARLAALLHDCGRQVPVTAMTAYARRQHLAVPRFAEIAERYPLLFHAYIGADLARRRYGVKDPAILSAIRKHTLGARRMGPLDRLLYVADSCSEDRRYRGAAALRRLALRDLGRAFKACVREKCRHAASRGGWVHPVTRELWNSIRG